jgi:tetratricopeptide (TPR) repeat protein
MKLHNKSWIGLLSLTAAVCLILTTGLTARSQEGGSDLPGIFRPKNPETKSKRRTRPTPKPKERTPPPPNVGERFEDALDEGNEARDARHYVDAERAYKIALQLKPRDARAAYGLGNIYTDQQRWEDAEKAYRQALSSGPNNADALIALSYVLVQPRTGASNAARLADAEAAARGAIRIEPGSALAHDRLGSALEARALLNAETEGEYRKAIEIDSNLAVAYIHLARLLRKMNRFKEADPLYTQAVDLAKDAPTLALVADAMQSEQRWSESVPVLRRALDLDARNPSALFLMAKALVVMKQYAEAEPLLKTVIEISPRGFAPYFILGSAYLRMDRGEDAEEILGRAAKIASPGDRKQLAGPFGFSGIGDNYMKAGKAGAAARAYKRALDLDPDNPELQGKLAEARAQVH